MTMTGFTPEQQYLYKTLMNADPAHVVIAREVATKLQAGDPLIGKGWKDFGAPTETSEWVQFEQAMKRFGSIICGEQDAAKAALPVIDAVLATKR